MRAVAALIGSAIAAVSGLWCGGGVAAGEPLDGPVEAVEQLDDERECDCHVKSLNESERVGHRQDL
jgi:hypothetical protein